MSVALAAPSSIARGRDGRRRVSAPVEHSILLTATLCLLALGAVMVYSASAPELLDGGGSGMSQLVSFVAWAGVGLAAMQLIARRGLAAVRPLTGPLLALAFVLLLAVKLPGIGHSANGAQRWIGAGPFEFEPSELMKLALLLYGVQVLAGRTGSPQAMRVALRRLLTVAGAAALLVLSQPDLGTTLVIAFTLTSLVVAAGVPLRLIGIGAAVLGCLVLLFSAVEPYAFARLTSFVNPWAHASTTGYQAVQGQVAIGSGGILGRGPGAGVTKDLYLPNGSTDFILAVIGEELGVAGICGVLCLYGLVIFAGMRIASAARDSYSLLMAAGVTSLFAVQAILNVFAVLSIAPLTGVPLPLVSYGSSSQLVMLAAMGMLLAVSRARAAGVEALAGTRAENRGGSADAAAADRDRSRRHGGSRDAGAGGRRRAGAARR
ncbi:MAG TPA: putative peptidoglycan glycosyltransferase FtsW [Solirubrobacteraceae bacterium]|nr:putative peptidoglycan glycosyltransferase FtsW [Solirubrobacteraceae bacterium]